MSTLSIKFSASVICAGLVCVSSANAATYFEPIDFSSQMNFNLQNNVNQLAPSGTFLTRYAVPFEIPTNANNSWGSGNGIDGGGGNDGRWNLEMAVNRANVKSIYTLADTDWGSPGAKLLTVTAFFDNGKSAEWDYVDGLHLRDWNGPGDTLDPGGSANEVFRVSPLLPTIWGNPTVLDMQTLAVPTSLQGAVLEKLVFSDVRNTFVHSAIVAGVTVSYVDPVTAGSIAAIPEPETYAMFMAGLGLLGFMARRRKTA